MAENDQPNQEKSVSIPDFDLSAFTSVGYAACVILFASISLLHDTRAHEVSSQASRLARAGNRPAAVALYEIAENTLLERDLNVALTATSVVLAAKRIRRTLRTNEEDEDLTETA